MSIKAIYDLKAGQLMNDLNYSDTKKQLLNVEIKNRIEKSRVSMNSQSQAYINSGSSIKDISGKRSCENNLRMIENVNGPSSGMLLFNITNFI